MPTEQIFFVGWVEHCETHLSLKMVGFAIALPTLHKNIFDLCITMSTGGNQKKIIVNLF